MQNWHLYFFSGAEPDLRTAGDEFAASVMSTEGMCGQGRAGSLQQTTAGAGLRWELVGQAAWAWGSKVGGMGFVDAVLFHSVRATGACE